MIDARHSSSFRDPSGYVFKENNLVKRAILPKYFKQYSALKKSGIFEKLFKNKLLIPHTEELESNSKIILLPHQIPFISYPYEWCFNQYKEAALLTLKLQKLALEYGFSLKDASAFNVTFHQGQAIFIDTLSFDFYEENKPWRAYKQFISHFFGPLLLAKYHGASLLKLTHSFIDGVPIKTIASLLPLKTKLNPFLYTNIHLLAKYETKYNEAQVQTTTEKQLTKKAQLNIVKSLYDYIKKLELNEQSEWGNYYDKTNYSEKAFDLKSQIINRWVDSLKPQTLIDVGGNDGTFVRRIKQPLKQALVCDIDNNAVDFNYRLAKQQKEQHITPLVLDVLSPSPAIGFNNKERFAFLTRIKNYNPDITLALAVIHHITLSGNIPFGMSALFFSSFSKHVIIEFPEQGDSWVEHLLNSKNEFKAHFNFYNIENFENAYSEYFTILEKEKIPNSKRVMYLLKKKDV